MDTGGIWKPGFQMSFDIGQIISSTCNSCFPSAKRKSWNISKLELEAWNNFLIMSV